VPDGAAVRGFTFQGAGKEPTAEVLPKNDAKATYEAIVAKIRDPALLEFVGYNLIRTSVFPVEPHGTQKVRLTYEHLLTADGNRVDYFLPRSEAIDYQVPWKVSVSIKSKTPIATVYSPSHEIEADRTDRQVVNVRTTAAATTTPGPFRLSYLLEQEGVTASLLAYPDPKAGGGYFLLLAGLPAAPSSVQSQPKIKREVTVVIDRSGSMHGEKIRQVQEAAAQVLAGLEDGEAFNIIAYNQDVELYSPRPVLRGEETMRSADAYVKQIRPTGGTNIHDALVKALEQKPCEGMLPIVLFLTDGLPTIGQTSETAIRSVADRNNPYSRRIFTFGVGVDVNTPLLQSLAAKTRATATIVLPKEDVEVKVAEVFKRLAGPVLAAPELSAVGADGKPDPGRVADVIPNRLPDLFEGDQLVVLGRYVRSEPLAFQMTGNYRGRKRTFEFSFTTDKATTRNGFVPRLWASRQIGVLVDAIRQSGANGAPAQTGSAAPFDPKVKELIDEVVRLSTEFGILTEYTAFLAKEGTDLTQRVQVLQEAVWNFDNRAIRVRSGIDSANQEMNSISQQRQYRLNYRNDYFDANLNRVSISNVQQVNDLAFYRRGDRWVDSRIVAQSAMKPPRVIAFGSEEFNQLVARLAEQGRQGSVSLRGDTLLVVDGEPVLVKQPEELTGAGAEASLPAEIQAKPLRAND
jgi:Ca-activated chloride channel family protein